MKLLEECLNVLYFDTFKMDLLAMVLLVFTVCMTIAIFASLLHLIIKKVWD